VDNSDIYDFRNRVASLGEQVVAVLVEEGEEGERHITTFLSEESQELEQKIYDLEAETIEKYQDKAFDFHVRPPLWLPVLAKGERRS